MNEQLAADLLQAMMAMMQLQQKAFMEQITAQRETDAAQRAADIARQDAQEARLTALTERITTNRRPAATPRSSARVPSFDLDKDKASFYTWKQKWEAHIVAHGLVDIEDEEDQKVRIRAEFTTAMSDHTQVADTSRFF
jgi:hypothetical protein